MRVRLVSMLLVVTAVVASSPSLAAVPYQVYEGLDGTATFLDDLSLDGRWMTFRDLRDGIRHLYLVDLRDEFGTPRPLGRIPRGAITQFTPDSTQYVWIGMDENGDEEDPKDRNLLRLVVDDPTPPQIVLESPKPPLRAIRAIDVDDTSTTMVLTASTTTDGDDVVVSALRFTDIVEDPATTAKAVVRLTPEDEDNNAVDAVVLPRSDGDAVAFTSRSTSTSHLNVARWDTPGTSPTVTRLTTSVTPTPLVFGADGEHLYVLEWAFRADASAGPDLYRVPLDGSAIASVSSVDPDDFEGELAATPTVDRTGIVYEYCDADGIHRTVLLSSVDDTNTSLATASCPEDGSTMYRQVVSDAHVLSSRFHSPTGGPTGRELWATSLEGDGTVALDQTSTAPYVDLGSVVLDPTGTWAAWRRGRSDGTQSHVLVSRIDGSGEVRRVHDEAATIRTQDYGFSADGEQLLVAARWDGPLEDVHAIELAVPDRRVTANPAERDERYIRTLAPTLAGTDVLYEGPLRQSRPGFVELFRSPLPTLTPRDLTATADATTVEVTWDLPARASDTAIRVTVDVGGRRLTRELPPTARTARFEGLEPTTDHVVGVTVEGPAGDGGTASQSVTTAAPGAGSAADPANTSGVERLAGQDRYETAAAVALEGFDRADTVYLAVGTDFPDALAGGVLAAADDAPVLLTATSELPAVTAGALGALAPSRVVALGGPAAISEDVLTAAGEAAGATTSRLAGEDRFATAAVIADQLTDTDTVYLSTGRNFPDALAASPVTAGAPILLVEPASLPGVTMDVLAALGPTTVVALGGAVAVSDDVLAAAADVTGASTRRLEGDDRYATAAVVAGQAGPVETVFVAVGENFPDALAAGPVAARAGATILLTTTTELPAATRRHLEAHRPSRIVVLGGEQVISADVADALGALMRGE